LDEIASDDVIDVAYTWLCERRQDYSANDDIWNVRWKWAELKPKLQADLIAGTYRFSALRRIVIEGATLDIWAALDALVLKAMAILLARHFKPHLSEQCHHLAGHGGSKAEVRAVAENLATNTFIFRTDVKSYHASIDHDILFEMLRPLIADERVLALLWQVIHHVVCDDGLYPEVKRGICLGCPTSPLLGALYLHQVDERIRALGLFYARFMNDWVVQDFLYLELVPGL
jgi:RNA-directed DNA polymerase